MDNAWLNRIGIILNFLAGFLIAPELIGIERIRRLEALLERRIDETTNVLKDRTAKYQHGYYGGTLDAAAHSLIVTLLAIVIIYTVLMKDFILTLKLLMLAFTLMYLSSFGEVLTDFFGGDLRRIGESKNWKGMREMGAIKFSVGLVIFLLLFSVPPFFIAIGGSMIYLASYPTALMLTILVGAQKLTAFIAVRLQGDDRIRSMIISWGIILFILGNLLQFIATF